MSQHLQLFQHYFCVFYIFKGLVFSIMKYDPKNKNCKVFLKHKFFLEVTIVYYSCFMSTQFFLKIHYMQNKKFLPVAYNIHVVFAHYFVKISTLWLLQYWVDFVSDSDWIKWPALKGYFISNIYIKYLRLNSTFVQFGIWVQWERLTSVFVKHAFNPQHQDKLLIYLFLGILLL